MLNLRLFLSLLSTFQISITWFLVYYIFHHLPGLLFTPLKDTKQKLLQNQGFHFLSYFTDIPRKEKKA